MKRVLVLASVIAALGLAAPAHADSNDEQFLAALEGAGLTHRGPDHAIAAGRAVCDLMDGGLSPMDTVNAVKTTNPGFSLKNAAQFAGIAATAYCPEHM